MNKKGANMTADDLFGVYFNFVNEAHYNYGMSKVVKDIMVSQYQQAPEKPR